MVTPKTIPRKRLIRAVTLTAFLLAIAGSSFYFYSSRPNTPPKLSRAPVSKVAEKGASNSAANPTNNSQVNQANVTPTPDPYSGWKTDQKSKYKLRYPSGWFNEQDVQASVNSDGAVLADEKVKLPGQISVNGVFATVSVSPITSIPDDIDTIMFKSPVGKVNISGGLGDSAQVFTKVAAMSIGGYPAISYTNDSSAVVSNAPNYDEVYVINKSNQYIRLDFFMNKGKEPNFRNQINLILNSLQLS